MRGPAWAQLMRQLAFYKLERRPAVIHESAQTRNAMRSNPFLLFRTDVGQQ
ncbi:hypothetical protein EDB86DRAFT_2795254 [Lactarius hatsudake]|nr:hypothetical protein EDB86DRAFT_2795254 [Lactarius hatsudake]